MSTHWFYKEKLYYRGNNTVQLSSFLEDNKSGFYFIEVSQAFLQFRLVNNRISKLRKEWNTEVDRLYNLTSKEGNVQTNIVGILNEYSSFS